MIQKIVQKDEAEGNGISRAKWRHGILDCLQDFKVSEIPRSVAFKAIEENPRCISSLLNTSPQQYALAAKYILTNLSDHRNIG